MQKIFCLRFLLWHYLYKKTRIFHIIWDCMEASRTTLLRLTIMNVCVDTFQNQSTPCNALV